MCGIAGIYSFNGPVERDTIVRFTDAISHRGPDGSDYTLLNKGKVALGHRRLSILDLSEGGRQPMSYADERFWITFNGEIYNFLEIRKQLSQKAYVFKTDSDTEVILAAFDCWGKDFLQRLNGMWAFAIFDRKDNSLFLARDRFGVKPLHFTFARDKRFAFASETVAFSSLEGFEKTFDQKNMCIALEDPDYIEGTGYTIYRDIFQLLPGHYIHLTETTQQITQHKWWETLAHKSAVPKSYNEQVEQFYALFEDACKIRLRSDVPVASALSGGMDSSAIYCTINDILKTSHGLERLADGAQQAFVAYYPGTPNDEKKYAEEVIRYTNGKATYIETDYKNLANELISTTVRFDAIAITPVMCATDVYKAMRGAGYKVSMDGHGADEMLYGYKQMVFDAYETAILNGDTRFEQDLLETYSGLFPSEQQAAASAHLNQYGQNIRPSLKKKVAQSLAPWYFNKRDTANILEANKALSVKESWLSGTVNKHVTPLGQSHFANYRHGQAEQKTYNLFHYTSLPVNLRDFDRASMQNSIEIRSPFMDWRLVSFVFSLPTASKVGGGFTKRILRDAMKDKMPESIRTRKLKIGLSAPLPSWFSGELKDFIMDEVSSSAFQDNPLWKGKEIKSFVESKRKSGWENFGEASRLWRFLNAHILIKNN